MILDNVEASNLIKFLDRVELKGHKERNEMNTLVSKIIADVQEKTVEENSDVSKDSQL